MERLLYILFSHIYRTRCQAAHANRGRSRFYADYCRHNRSALELSGTPQKKDIKNFANLELIEGMNKGEGCIVCLSGEP